jgi:uncharacterized membrane protein
MMAILLFVIALTVMIYRIESPVLFYLLYPGEIVSLLITGGHGGTLLQDRIAPVASVAVNFLVYATVFNVIYRLFLNQTDPRRVAGGRRS